jgi:hypothetical protein
MPAPDDLKLFERDLEVAEQQQPDALPVKLRRRDRRRLSRAHTQLAELQLKQQRGELERQLAEQQQARPAVQRIRGRVIVWVAALITALVIGIVVILTQVAFYGDNLHHRKVDAFGFSSIDLAYFVPFAVEGLGWVCALLSVTAAINNRPSARYSRFMWLFSGCAAAVNAVHNISNNDWLTGLVLGGLSLAGPLVVHLALLWSRDSDQSKTTDDFRAEFQRRVHGLLIQVAQVICHPYTTARAVGVATDYRVAWPLAYRTALLKRRDEVQELLERQFAAMLEQAGEALATSRAGEALLATTAVEIEPSIVAELPLARSSSPDEITRHLAPLTERKALEYAFEQLNTTDVPTALTWLEEHGRTVDRSNAYKNAKLIGQQEQERAS